MNDTVEPILKHILDLCQLPYSGIRSQHDAEIDTTILHIETDQVDTYIDDHAEVLRSINYLLKKLVEQQTDTPFRTTVDVDNFNTKHINDIKIKARILAERAKSFDRTVACEPMSAFDRLIVHAYAGQLPGITTESVGTGRDRHVTITYSPTESLV